MPQAELTRYSTREEWLAGRWGIGASDVATILGVSPYRDSSRVALWHRLRGEDEVKQESERMAFGRRAEQLVLDMFAEQTELAVVPTPLTIVRSTETPWAFASPDGLVAEGGGVEERTLDGALGVVEAKVTNGRIDFGDPTDLRAAAFEAQVMWQLYVTGLSSGWVAILDSFRDRVLVHELPRDDDTVAWLVERCAAFWTSVQEGSEPPPDDVGVWGRYHPPRQREEVEVPELLAATLLSARRTVAQAEEALAVVQRQVVEAMTFEDGTTAEYATVKGRKVASFIQSMTLDEAALALAEPDAYASCCHRFDRTEFGRVHARIAREYRTVNGARPFKVLGWKEGDDDDHTDAA